MCAESRNGWFDNWGTHHHTAALDGDELIGWQIRALDLENLDLDGWTKGNAYVNGFNLGRFWSRGPQRTLYVPGPLIRKGSNVLAILELQGSATCDVRFASGPDLGPDEK